MGSTTDYNKEWCDERHDKISKGITDLQTSSQQMLVSLGKIETRLEEKDKQNGLIYKLLPILLALLAGGGGGAVMARVSAPAQAAQASTSTVVAE